MTTNYMYESETGYKWLDAATALRKAIVDSMRAGCLGVPMTVADFVTVMRHANSADARSLDEQLLDFARSCGLRFELENHAHDVRFYV